MTPAERLAALVGDWRVLRVIRHRDGSIVRFEGRASWVQEGVVLRCVETGEMRQAGQSFQARRETLWRATAGALEIAFADGRPFHRIDAGLRVEARHDCPPDDYRLRYDFTAWPCWSVRWRVIGPRKDYAALTGHAPSG